MSCSLFERLDALGLQCQWVEDSTRCRTLGARLTVVVCDGDYTAAWEAPTTMPDVPDCAFAGSLVGVLASVRSHIYRWVATHPDLRQDFESLSCAPVPIGRARRARG